MTEPVILNPPEEGDAYPLTLGITERVTQALELPYPPSVNHYWRIFVPPGRKIAPRIIISSDGRAFKEAAKRAAWSSGCTMMRGEIRIRVDVYRPARRGDLDNTLKCVLDALSGVVYEDDGSIVYLEAHRHEDKMNPRVHVTIEGERA